MSHYRKLTTGLIAGWFAFSLVASALHLFKTGPDQPPLALGLAALMPVAVFLVWSALSPPFRTFALSLDTRTLTRVHSLRFVGFVFLVLATYGILPRVFAWPAGWGDIAMGVTASFVAVKLANPDHRRSFIAWQLLGITDLVLAVSLAALAGVLDPQGIPTTPMTILPLSLIPTFGVPFLLILHLISIAQARQWRVDVPSRIANAATA